MRPIQERLTMLAADLREDSRKAGIAAAEARPDVEDTAAVLATLQQTEAELNAQIDELERRLNETRRHILQAEAEHEQAKSVVKRHECDGQEAADMADRLDQLARGHRAPDAVPPAEALAATGLMVEPPKEVDREAAGREVTTLAWGGDPHEVRCDCGSPDGDHCPVCDHPDDVPPAPGDVPVATPPVPTAPAGELVATTGPTTTMPDVGLNPRPLPPAPAAGKARHEKPSDGLMSRVTGGFKALLDKPETTDQQGDDQ